MVETKSTGKLVTLGKGFIISAETNRDDVCDEENEIASEEQNDDLTEEFPEEE